MTTLRVIGEQLREARKRKKVTQLELANRSAVHRNTIGALEAGIGNVELNTLIAVCTALGLDIQLVPEQLSGHVTQQAGAQPSALQRRLAYHLNAHSGRLQKGVK